MKSRNSHPKLYMYKRVVEAKLYIDNCYDKKISLSTISDQAHFSKYHFLRLFKNAFGKSPYKYLIDVRISNAKSLLNTGSSVKETCFKVGFESIPSFTILFKKQVGISPNRYARKLTTLKEQKLNMPLRFIPNCFVESYGWGR